MKLFYIEIHQSGFFFFCGGHHVPEVKNLTEACRITRLGNQKTIKIYDYRDIKAPATHTLIDT